MAIDRRTVLGYGLCGLAWPHVSAAASPSRDRLVVGIMGLNGRGTRLANAFARLDGVEVGALCDVDPRAIEKAARVVAKHQERRPARVGDFRRVLDDAAIDALVVAAPDHWHAPAAILACAAGKDVYVEKPCSHNAREGELLVEAAAKHGRIVQMGNQRRSWPAVLDAIAAVHDGRIGRAYAARCWYANGRGPTGRRTPAAVPSWLDWELWQGPAPRRAFSDNVVHYKWHWYWAWGTGELGNNGVHALDLARWALGVDHPVHVVSSGGRLRFDDDQETPDTQSVAYRFERGALITWEGLSCHPHGPDGSGFGACILGTEGSVTIGAKEWSLCDPAGKVVHRAPIAGGDGSHCQDFALAVRSRKAPHSAIDDACKSTLLCHLGNIAQRTGRALCCDPKTGRITGDEAAMGLWTRAYTEGWQPVV